MAIATTIRTFASIMHTGFGSWVNLNLASTTGIGVSAGSQVGTTTSGSAIVTGLTSTANLNVGQPVSGTGIPAGATILSIDSATQIHLSANATANGTPTLTFGATPLTITSAAGAPGASGATIVVTPYQELPNLGYKCRVNTPAQFGNYLTIRGGDAVSG